MSPDPSRLLPLGDLSFHVLLALNEGSAHGYALGKLIEERTEGRLKPTTGSLYQAIRRLTDAGLIEAVPRPPEASDRRRQYFRITRFGIEVASAEARRLEGLVSLARAARLLGDVS